MKRLFSLALGCMLLLTCEACQRTCGEPDTCLLVPDGGRLEAKVGIPPLATEGDSRLIGDRVFAVFQKVFDRWLQETDYSVARNGKPRLIVTSIDNNTRLKLRDLEMHYLLKTIAQEDGRFNVVVATALKGKDYLQAHLLNDPLYSNSSRQVTPGKALQCFATLQISQVNSPDSDRAEDLLLDLTLYDVESDDLVISDWDIVGIEEKVL